MRDEAQIESDSVDVLLYNQVKMAEQHNSNFRSTGSFHIDNPSYYDNTYSVPTLSKERTELLTVGSEAVVVGAQLIEGTAQGYNVTYSQLEQWDINGTKFFTMIEPNFSGISNRGGHTVYRHSPHFLSAQEMLADSAARNYSNYLEMEDSIYKNWTRRWRNFFGWE